MGLAEVSISPFAIIIVLAIANAFLITEIFLKYLKTKAVEEVNKKNKMYFDAYFSRKGAYENGES